MFKWWIIGSILVLSLWGCSSVRLGYWEVHWGCPVWWQDNGLGPDHIRSSDKPVNVYQQEHLN